MQSNTITLFLFFYDSYRSKTWTELLRFCFLRFTLLVTLFNLRYLLISKIRKLFSDICSEEKIRNFSSHTSLFDPWSCTISRYYLALGRLFLQGPAARYLSIMLSSPSYDIYGHWAQVIVSFLTHPYAWNMPMPSRMVRSFERIISWCGHLDIHEMCCFILDTNI